MPDRLRSFDAKQATNWLAVPFDLYCEGGAPDFKSQYSPTLWSRNRLINITTKVLAGGANKDVDSWALPQGFPQLVTAYPPRFGCGPSPGRGTSTEGQTCRQ
ncbi:hypothetical protein GCM10010331_15760 [Streptomyces xanthochromogenes]|nr:hypothetical protein GCM10010331_15760 [Streptomyces xanthochromogenes]